MFIKYLIIKTFAGSCIIMCYNSVCIAEVSALVLLIFIFFIIADMCLKDIM